MDGNCIYKYILQNDMLIQVYVFHVLYILISHMFMSVYVKILYIYFDIQEYASICYLMRVYTRIYANIRVYTNFQNNLKKYA